MVKKNHETDQENFWFGQFGTEYIDRNKGSKLLASKFLTNCYNQHNFPVTIIRFYQLFGPKQHTNRFIPILITACLSKRKFATSSGSQSRDFLYVDDAINAIIKCIKAENSKGKIFNIGSGKPTKLKKIMKITLHSLEC